MQRKAASQSALEPRLGAQPLGRGLVPFQVLAPASVTNPTNLASIHQLINSSTVFWKLRNSIRNPDFASEAPIIAVLRKRGVFFRAMATHSPRHAAPLLRHLRPRDLSVSPPDSTRSTAHDGRDAHWSGEEPWGPLAALNESLVPGKP